MPPRFPEPPLLPRVVLSREIGYDAVRAAVKAGELVRVRDGAYTDPPTFTMRWAVREHLQLARCVALSRQLTCEFVFSHQSAALIHGCWTAPDDGRVHITQTVRPSRDVADLRRHRRPTIPVDDLTVVNGLRVTTLERTVEDCARTLHPRQAMAIVDSAIRILARPDRFSRVVSEKRIALLRARLRDRLDARRGERGIVRARAVVDHADGFSESAGESDLRWLALSRGLPRPMAQVPVETSTGTYFGDLGWIVEGTAAHGDSARLIVAEYDGAQKYDPSPGAAPGSPLYAEKIREDAMRAAGVVVHRFVRRDLADADGAFARLCGGFPPAVIGGRRPVPGLLSRRSRPV